MTAPLRLGLNIDHVATVRNARGGAFPDPVRAAHLAIAAGADGITAHLREDRRHIRDGDLERLCLEIGAPINLEMAATSELLAIALRLRPRAVCLVPEKREERTTEGGLDIVSQKAAVAPVVRELGESGIRVSLFVEPDMDTIEEAAMLGAAVVELHTGTWCSAVAAGVDAAAARQKLEQAARHAATLGLEVHAGHGLDYVTAEAIAMLPEIVELNIGHFLIGEAIFSGLANVVETMRAAMQRGRSKMVAA